jgi:uncharacterized protein YhaN
VTTSLRLRSLFAENFGGLVKRSLQFPDQPFVVVLGDNESGKTRLRSLLSWLLVGPHGDTKSSHRFGDADHVVSGTMEALLGTETVRAKGAFRILKSGAPNENGLSVAFRGATLSASDWRKQLSGVDPSVLNAIYLMSGTDLHDGTGVHVGISDLAVSGLSGADRAPAARTALKGEWKSALKQTGENADSAAVLGRRLKTSGDRLRALQGDAADYAAHQGALAAIDNKLDGVAASRAEINADIAALDAVAAIAEDRRELGRLERELAELEMLDGSWETMAERRDAVIASIRAVESLAHEERTASDVFEHTCREVGLSADEAQSIQIGAVDVKVLTDLAAAASQAQTFLQGAQTELERAEALLREADRHFDQTVDHCRDLDRSALSMVTLSDDERAGVLTAIALLQKAEGAVDGAEAARRAAEGECRLAAIALERAEADWSGFGLGSSAEEWLAGARATSASQAGKNAMLALVVAAVVSLGAVLALPRPLAAVVTLAALAVAVLARRRRSEEPGVVDDPATSAAAALVRERRLAWDLAEDTVEKRRISVEETSKDRDARADDVIQHVSRAGYISAGPSADEHRTRLERVVAAVDAMSIASQRERERDEALAERDIRARQLDGAMSELRDALVERGIPSRYEPVQAAQQIVEFQRASAAAVARAGACSIHDAARADLDRLLEPIAAIIEGWTLDDVASRVDHVATVARERSLLTAGMKQLRSAIESRLRDDARAQAVYDEDLEAASLVARREQLARAAVQLDEDAQEWATERGRLRGELRSVEQKDEVAALQLELGEIEELLDQRLVEGVSALLAEKVLAEIAERVRIQNQPELITRATALVEQVVPEWKAILTERNDKGDLDISVLRTDGALVPVSRLSTGAQALLYLALRLAAAEQDAVMRRGGLRMPIICDDPLVHFDDARALSAAQLLATAANDGHQVIVFTCSEHMASIAAKAGAAVVHHH